MSSSICPACESSDVVYRPSTREYECHNCGHIFAAPDDEILMNKMPPKTSLELSKQARRKTVEIERVYASAKSTGRCPACKSVLRELAGDTFYCEKCEKVIAPATFDPSKPLSTPSPSEDNASHQHERYYESRISRGKEP